METDQIIQLLRMGKIGVMPTDTIYGIVGSALNPQTVETLYRLRKRSTNKPMIILISSLSDLKRFDIKLTDQQKSYLQKIWPNPVSVVLSCLDEKFKYLHRGTQSLAFRIPKKIGLLNILKEVGPMVAPSANYEGQAPAKNILQAKKYFESMIAFYLDEGEIQSKSSTIIKLTDQGSAIVLRKGSHII